MGNELTDGERLIQLETEVRTLIGAVLRMEAKLDAQGANYVTKDVMAEMLRSRDERIARLETEAQQRQTNWPAWVAALAAVAALIIAAWPKG